MCLMSSVWLPPVSFPRWTAAAPLPHQNSPRPAGRSGLWALAKLLLCPRPQCALDFVCASKGCGGLPQSHGASAVLWTLVAYKAKCSGSHLPSARSLGWRGLTWVSELLLLWEEPLQYNPPNLWVIHPGVTCDFNILSIHLSYLSHCDLFPLWPFSFLKTFSGGSYLVIDGCST